VTVSSLWQHPLYSSFKDVKAGERVYRDSVRWFVLHHPHRPPVVLGHLSGAANYYEPELPLLRLDRISKTDWQAIRDWQHRHGVTIAAALQAYDQRQLFAPDGVLLPCDWQPRGTYKWVTFYDCPPP
jgi:hypothetical protein